MNIDNKSGIGKLIATWAFKYALKPNLDKESFIYKIFDKIVYSKLRDIFGGKVAKLVSGGAALNKEIYQFFL